jgi:hypothetical protein
MGENVWHLGLRAKRFEGIRSVVSEGKDILQFRTLKAVEEKADEVERLIDEHGKKRLEAFEDVVKEDPLALQAKLRWQGRQGRLLQARSDGKVADPPCFNRGRDEPPWNSIGLYEPGDRHVRQQSVREIPAPGFDGGGRV